MTTTFKVVEIYRNISTSNLNSNKIINQTSNDQLTVSDDTKLSTTTNQTNQFLSILGFNLIGGYLTDFPITIIDILNQNGKTVKVEEGDTILEVNGISTRNMTLSEVYKQLRCCGNRIYLKIKSEPDYKSKFKQLLINGDNQIRSQRKDEDKSKQQPSSFNFNLIRNASKSCDYNINGSNNNNSSNVCCCNVGVSVNTTSINSNSTSCCCGNNNNSPNNLTHSNTSSNVSCSSTTNINLDTSSISASITSILINNTTRSSTTTLTITNETTLIDNNNCNNNNNTNNLPISNQESSTSSTSTTSSQSTSNSPVSSNDSSSSVCLTNNSESLLNQEKNHINEHVYDNNNTLVNSNNMPSNLQNNSNTSLLNNNQTQSNNTSTPPVLTFQIEIDDSIKKRIDEKLKEISSGDSDSDSDVQVYTPKGVDLPSAQRLAKRLYYLDGFKPSDVVRHLSKKNDFSSLVAEEYLKLFNFQSLTLDAALRKFLKQFQLVGDAQEKERVLMYFAKRYVDANNTAFTDVDSCHTLTCAIMLLNTDLHDPKVQNKMTLNEFIENLKGLNNGFNFPDVLLESLYSAIKNEPLECACLDNEDMGYEDRNGNGMSGSINGNFTLRPLGSNPFLQMPDPQTAKEYKFGWLLRKCCIDADGKKAAFLKRSWKMFYASLRDMVLYLHKDDKVFKNNTFDNITNAIRIHHAFASVANDYKKKQYVFRLKTADWAEYLFQTSNSNELFDWVSTINLVAAMFSSPPLPGGIGSNKTFQRPLLPVSKTRYTLQEQYEYHKKHLKQLQSDLARLESAAGAFNNSNNLNGNSNSISKEEKYFDKDKYNYLQFEIQRYTVYANILEEKILSEQQQQQQQQSSTSNLTNQQSPLIKPIINQNFVLNEYNHHMFNSTQINNVGGVVGFGMTSGGSSSTSGAPIYLNGGLINGHFNHNFNETPTKSMPTTPTHFNSPLKQQQQQQQQQQLQAQNLHVNFNLSPDSTTKNFSENLTGLGNLSISSPTTTNTTTTSTTLTNTPTINSKKFNNYYD